MIFYKPKPKPRIEDDDELYQRYWSEFTEYYIANSLSLTSSNRPNDGDTRPKSYYFRIDNFAPFHIDLGVSLLSDSEISAKY